MNALFMGICGFGVTFTCFKVLFRIVGSTPRDWPRLICVTTATKLPEKWIYYFFFFKLNRSLLAVSSFLSEFQAPVWSGKSIIVVKWALSKHPCGGTTPVHAPASVWGWLWALAAPALQSGCAYTDSGRYLIIWFYMGTRVYRTRWSMFSPGCGFMGIHRLSWTTARWSELSIFTS